MLIFIEKIILTRIIIFPYQRVWIWILIIKVAENRLFDMHNPLLVKVLQTTALKRKRKREIKREREKERRKVP